MRVSESLRGLCRSRVWRIGGLVVFWTWNVLFLALVAFGFVPLVLAEAVADAARGRLAWELVATGFLLTGLPVASVVFALRKLRGQPEKVTMLFYALEAPLGLLCLARIFLVRELSPGLTHLLASFFLAASFVAIELAGGIARRRWARHVQLAGHAVGLVVALYAAAVVAFFAVPAAVGLIRAFFRFDWLVDFGRAVLSSHGTAFLMLIIGTPFLLLSATLFIGTPLALPVLYVRSFLRMFRAHRAALGEWALAPCAAAVVASVGLFLAANRQPQVAAFAALAEPPRDDAARARLLERQEEIRAGLVNAYLGPYRYLGARGAPGDLASLYHQEVGLPYEVAESVQRAFATLAAPVLYDGESLYEDEARAEGLYRDFFDAPIQKRESEAVLRALTTTYSHADREAGLLDRGQRRVLLARQEVTITRQGPAAEVEIHDRWENQTFDQQEVVLTFDLPEEAAVTGLWLGESDDRAARFEARVSPRGAAQKVYRREVQGRVDPALLEQIGPRQYRLRAFPVPPKPSAGQAVRPLHVWLTYAALPQGRTFPLPRLLERRNGFWDARTERLLGEQVIRDGGRAGREDQDWVIPDEGLREVTAAPSLTVALADGRVLQRESRPGVLGDWTGRRLAVVVDRSFSMGRRERELRAELDFVDRTLAGRSDVDLFLTSSPLRGEPARRLEHARALARTPLLFFGGSSLGAMLAEVDALAPAVPYDAIVVLTDDGSLDLARDRAGPPPASSPPLWLVHVGGDFPPGYDDGVLARVERSRGGVAASVAEAFARQTALADPDVVSADGEVVWRLDHAPGPPGAAARPDPLLQRIAARQLILADARAFGGGGVPALDSLHALAVKYRVVSSYSSMIVLVDERQRRALAEAEHAQDRFERPVDPETKSLSQPSSPFGLTATPEPHEWILMGLAAAGLLQAARLRRRRVDIRSGP
jgi:putative PEP-CTERM system integral membrane protein